MEKITLNAAVRENYGKGSARSLRREGSIPAVIYKGSEASPLTLNRKEIVTFINQSHGEQVLINLQFQGGASRLALMKEYQVDPVKGGLLHADFIEVALDKKIRVKVHVVTTGEPIGVKRDKGLLQHMLREVEIEALPNDIPGHIEIDIAGMQLNQTIHVSDLKVSSAVRIITDGIEPIASVTTAVVAATPAEAAAAAAETAAAPAAEKKG